MNAISSDAATEELSELLQELSEKLVTAPSRVLVLARRDRHCVMVQVTVEEQDLGRLLGSNGETAKALRRIANSVAGKHQVICDLSLGTYASQGRGGNSGS